MTLILGLIGFASGVTAIFTFHRAATHAKREVSCRLDHKRKPS